MPICFLKDILISEMLRYRECLRVKDTAWCECVHVCVCELFSSIPLFATPWTVACQASVQGILQARILGWVAMPSSRGSSPPRDRTHVPWRTLHHLMSKGKPAATCDTVCAFVRRVLSIRLDSGTWLR